MKVLILDLYDGFEIVILDDNGAEVKRFPFDQEDTRETLPEVFNTLGIEASYEECY